jgi:hypothetical protein
MPATRTGLARLLAISLVACVVPRAGADRPSDGPVSSDPLFTALTVDGRAVSGRIREFGPKGELTLVPAEGPEQTFAVEKLVKVTRNGVSAPAGPEASVVLFPGGDRLYRTAIGASNETTLDVQSFSLGHLSVPLDSALGLVLALPTDSDALDDLIAKVRGVPRTSEVVWLANGDKLTGGFLGLGDRTVEFQPGKDPVKLDRTGVVALGFDPALVSYPKPDSGYYEVTLSDGSRLGVSGLRFERGHLLARARFGAAVKVPVAELNRLHARTSSVVYLSERPVLDERYEAYVGPPRHYRKDANVEGHPMRLSGQDFERGIGTESRTLLAYRLEPGDKRFQAQVGLDDRAGPLGSVVFRVFVDKAEKFVSPPLSARDAPRTIDLDVTGTKVLILITEFGPRGGIRDLADWGEARIIR